jgi:hypothetical protein
MENDVFGDSIETNLELHVHMKQTNSCSIDSLSMCMY